MGNRKYKYNVYEVNDVTRYLVEKDVSFGRLKERCIAIYMMYRNNAKEDGDLSSVKGWTREIALIRKYTLKDINKLQKRYFDNGEEFIISNK